jgi:hypothetical protein
MSDIRKHAVEETATLHLRDADDELMYADDEKTKPRTVTLYGPGSRTFAKAQTRQSNRYIDRLKKKGKSDISADDKTKETADFLADCTASMENVEYDALQGEALYKAVYSDQSIGFVAEQVNKYMGEWGNFTKGSAKS